MGLQPTCIFHQLIERVDKCIAEATAAGLTDTANLLRIVKLDILAKAYGIGDDELDALLDELAASDRPNEDP